MDFYTCSGLNRPVRLSEATRQFAYDSLNHRYGLDTRKTPTVSLNHIENFESMSEIKKYDAAIYEIATKAPIRICKNEKISGAATLGQAINHQVPATYNDGILWMSVSHLTVDFETVVKKGVNHILDRVKLSLEKYKGTEKEPFIQSCAHCIECMKLYHSRYLKELENKSVKVINCTCPFVIKTQKIIEEHYLKGFRIIIAGEKNHPDVIGLNGWCDNTATIIDENYQDIELNDDEKVCLVSQTTYSAAKFEKILDFFSKKTLKTLEIFTE